MTGESFLIPETNFLGFIPSSIPGQKWMVCAWSDCDRPARGQHLMSLPAENRAWDTYAFCSGQHKQWWAESPRPT